MFLRLNEGVVVNLCKKIPKKLSYFGESFYLYPATTTTDTLQQQQNQFNSTKGTHSLMLSAMAAKQMASCREARMALQVDQRNIRFHSPNVLKVADLFSLEWQELIRLLIILPNSLKCAMNWIEKKSALRWPKSAEQDTMIINGSNTAPCWQELLEDLQDEVPLVIDSSLVYQSKIFFLAQRAQTDLLIFITLNSSKIEQCWMTNFVQFLLINFEKFSHWGKRIIRNYISQNDLDMFNSSEIVQKRLHANSVVSCVNVDKFEGMIESFSKSKHTDLKPYQVLMNIGDRKRAPALLSVPILSAQVQPPQINDQKLRLTLDDANFEVTLTNKDPLLINQEEQAPGLQNADRRDLHNETQKRENLDMNHCENQPYKRQRVDTEDENSCEMQSINRHGLKNKAYEKEVVEIHDYTSPTCKRRKVETNDIVADKQVNFENCDQSKEDNTSQSEKDSTSYLICYLKSLGQYSTVMQLRDLINERKDLESCCLLLNSLSAIRLECIDQMCDLLCLAALEEKEVCFFMNCCLSSNLTLGLSTVKKFVLNSVTKFLLKLEIAVSRNVSTCLLDMAKARKELVISSVLLPILTSKEINTYQEEIILQILSSGDLQEDDVIEIFSSYLGECLHSDAVISESGLKFMEVILEKKLPLNPDVVSNLVTVLEKNSERIKDSNRFLKIVILLSKFYKSEISGNKDRLEVIVRKSNSFLKKNALSGLKKL